MGPKKIVSTIEIYRKVLRKENIPKKRMDPKLKFSELNHDQILAHAHFLCGGAKRYARDPKKKGKANRHLGVIQTCLSFVGRYTLEEIMEHNKP